MPAEALLKIKARSGDWPSKKNGVFFLANELFKIYFQVRLRTCNLDEARQ